MAASNPMLFPVYRFYLNSNPGLRFYTATPTIENLAGLTPEGPKFRVFLEQANGTVPVYHFALGNNHYYSLNQNDPAAAGWTNLGVVWYAFAPTSSAPENAAPLQHYQLTGSNPHIDFYTPDPNVEALGQYTPAGNIGYVYPMIISGGYYVGKSTFGPMIPEMFGPGKYQHGVIQRDQTGAYLAFVIEYSDPNPPVNNEQPETYIFYSDTPYYALTVSNLFLATSDGLPINLIPAPPMQYVPPQQEKGVQFFTTTTGTYALLTAQLYDYGGGTHDGSFNFYTAAGLLVYCMGLIPLPGETNPFINVLGTVQPGQFGLGLPSEIQFWQTQVAPPLSEILTQGQYTNGDLSYLDLSEAQFPNFNFSGTNFQCTKLTGANLAGANFTNCDLTTIFFDSKTTLTYAQNQPMIFNGATLPFELVGKKWQWFNLAGATIQNLRYWLAADAQPLQATGAKLSGLNQNNLRMLPLQKAVLDYAVLDGLDLDGTDFTNATLIDASLHGVDLSNAVLTGATMTGSQLGSLALRFALPSSAEGDLNASNLSALTPLFAQNGITLSQNVTIYKTAANWELNDAGNNHIYTISKVTPPGQSALITVYTALASNPSFTLGLNYEADLDAGNVNALIRGIPTRGDFALKQRHAFA